MANKRVDEVVLTNLVGDAIGTDTLVNAYFNNDAKSVLSAMAAGNNIENVTNFLDKANYNTRSRGFTGKSNLGDLQMIAMDLYMNNDNAMAFEGHLVTNPQLLEEGILYSGLEQAKDNFVKAKENMPSLQKIA